MYAGVDFDGVVPCLSGQPVSLVSRVEVLAMVCSVPSEHGLDVKMTALEPLWEILDEDDIFS